MPTNFALNGGSYTTNSGDTWDVISFRVYGSELHMDLLLGANPEVNYTARFDAGVVIVVPPLPVASLSTSLPPWRLP